MRGPSLTYMNSLVTFTDVKLFDKNTGKTAFGTTDLFRYCGFWLLKLGNPGHIQFHFFASLKTSRILTLPENKGSENKSG